jgi:hypothetical protein
LNYVSGDPLTDMDEHPEQFKKVKLEDESSH